jgi:hypothetical protein
MVARLSYKTDGPASHRRLHKIALVLLFAAALPCFEASARANAIVNGNFAATSNSGLVNGQAMQIYGATANTVTGWSECTYSAGPPIVSTCPSGATTPTNGNNALGFLYTYGAQAVTATDTFGTFKLASSGTIPNTYPGACTTVVNGCGNYLALDGSSSYNMAIYQTVTGLTQGASYLLTFYMAAGQQLGNSNPTTEDWKVYFGSSTPQTTTVISNPGGSFTPWSLVTMKFTADSTSDVLEFLAQGGPAGDPPMDFLANVVLTQTPEPAGLALAGFAMLSLFAVRKRWLKRA